MQLGWQAVCSSCAISSAQAQAEVKGLLKGQASLGSLKTDLCWLEPCKK